MKSSPLIGFIGQGWIGKNYADNLEDRGYKVVRYSQEKPYISNKNKIKNCDIVLIAVPAPTTPKGFDDTIIRQVLKLVGKGKIAVIKSTIPPDTTEKLQKENPDIYVFHSPEFLSKATAREDVDHPYMNIIGLPKNNKVYKEKAQMVMSVLPKASTNIICQAKEAEIIKYACNCFKYSKVVFFNLIYDLCQNLNCDFEQIKKALEADPMIANWHLDPVHKSGRGAGGCCFIKDFAAFKDFYSKYNKNDKLGIAVINALEAKNLKLLKDSNKSQDEVAKVCSIC